MRKQRAVRLKRRLNCEHLEPRRYLSAVSFEWHDIDIVRDGPLKGIAGVDWTGDGDMDLVVSDGKQLLLYENADALASFDEPIAIVDAGLFDALKTADMDGDSDVDIIASRARPCQVEPCNSELVWLENTGTVGNVPMQHAIAVLAWDAFNVTDISGDGHVDVIVDGKWYENLGAGLKFQEHTYEPPAWGSFSLEAVDLDGDHDADLLRGLFLQGVDWIANSDGKGTLARVGDILNEFALTRAAAGDMDGDGDADIVHAAAGNGVRSGIAWSENVSGTGDFGPQMSIEPEALNCEPCYPYALVTADVDVDGDIDVFAASNEGSLNGLGWYENLQPGRFSQFQLIGDFAGGFTVEFPILFADVDADGDMDVVVRRTIGTEDTLGWYENRGSRRIGDVNHDGDFDQFDIVVLLQTGKYLTGETATFGDGDFNGDGLFDSLDIVAALQTGNYLQGPNAAIAPGGVLNDGQTSIIYTRSSGEIAVDAPAGKELTSINIVSANSVFTCLFPMNLPGGLADCYDHKIFKATFGGSFGSLSFGNVAQVGLSEEFVARDLTVVGSLAGGGPFGNVDLIYRCGGPHVGDDLAGASFVGQDLANACFTSAVLVGADFRGANLIGAHFGNATLSAANFDKAIVSGAGFSGTTNSGYTAEQLYGTASYENGDLTGIELSHNDLRGWNFARQNLSGAYLQGSDFSSLLEVGANQIRFVQSSFAGANLTGAVFQNANLKNADFTDATVAGADLSNTLGFTREQLYSTASYLAENLEGISLSGIDLSGWNFSGQNLTEVDLGSATLLHAGLQQADLTRASLTSADLSGSDLSHANLKGASFRGANLTDVDLRGADLRGAGGFTPATSTRIENAILPDGTIRVLDIQAADRLIIRDQRIGMHEQRTGMLKLIGISVDQTLIVSNGGTIEMVLEDTHWTSTVGVSSTVTPELDGTLRISFGEFVDPAQLSGATFDLFDWGTPLDPASRFERIELPTGTVWDVSRLYTTGEVTFTSMLQAGDANGDLQFDQKDIVQVLQAAKYLSGETATFEEGDFNGDGLFDSLDIVVALQTGNYLQTVHNAISPGGIEGDNQASIGYDARTGELWVEPPEGREFTSVNIDSTAGIFVNNRQPHFPCDFFCPPRTHNIVKGGLGESFGRISIGEVVIPGLPFDFVINDLSVAGSLFGGGDLGDVDLIYRPTNPITAGGVEGDNQASIGYDARTGELWVEPPEGREFTSVNIDSTAGIFANNPPPVFQNCGFGGGCLSPTHHIFKATFGGSFGRISFGEVAVLGVPEDLVINDLSVTGSLLGGGVLGDVDLIYRPIVGDSNHDAAFNQLDIVLVLQAVKYLTGDPATFEEGDWNEDGVFDQLDIVLALQSGNYLQNSFAVDVFFAQIAD